MISIERAPNNTVGVRPSIGTIGRLQMLVPGAVGVLSWSGEPALLAILAVVPWLIMRQTSRGDAGLAALSYYLGASFCVVPACSTFLDQPSMIVGFACWVGASLVLALPWALCWSAKRGLAGIGAVVALALSAVPPIGLIGWTSPVTAAGMLFPGMGLVGIAVFLSAISWSIVRPSGAFFAVIATTVALCYGDASPSTVWRGVDTALGGARATNPAREFAAIEAIEAAVRASKSQVIVMPESVLNDWRETEREFLKPLSEELIKAHHTLIVGATLRGANGTWENIALGLGEHVFTYRQHIPVPIGMVRPWRPPSFDINLGGPYTVNLAGERAAVLICYEQLLVWPILRAALEHPTQLVGLANDTWVQKTRIPAMQRAALISWSSLLGIPVTAAVNR